MRAKPNQAQQLVEAMKEWEAFHPVDDYDRMRPIKTLREEYSNRTGGKPAWAFPSGQVT